MRKFVFCLAGCAVVLAGAWFYFFPAPLAVARGRVAVRHAAGDAEESAKIQRIESGLMPAIQIKGQPVKPMGLAERMEFFKVPGVSIAFFEGGKIAWTRAYGYADLESKRRVTPETLFQAASISKPVASLAALRLVRDGKLSLDENVNAKLKSWKVPENEFTKEQKVTLRRILSHSAGTTVHGFAGYASDEAVPTVLQVLNGEKPANSDPVRVDVVPGTMERYSGGGMTIMQLLLTDVTGKAFPEIVKESVLEPAGMTSSGYMQPLPKNLWTNAAMAYRSDGTAVKGGWHTYPELAAAGLWTTPSDLARVAIEVKKEYDGTSDKILTQKLAQEMLTRQKGNFGLGFEIEAPGKKKHFGHGGSNEGYRCELLAWTDSGQGVAIMTNSDAGGGLIAEIMLSVAKEYGWPEPEPVVHSLAKVDAGTIASYAGTYEGDTVGKLNFTAKDGKLYLQADFLGTELHEMMPETDSTFFILSANIQFSFEKNEQGVVDKVVIDAGDKFVAKRRP